MEILLLLMKSIVLGIVEGVTEFLPVSSTGHMVIFENLMSFNGLTPHYVEMYTYVIQLGAILAVVILYFDKLKGTFANFFPRQVGYEQSGFKFWMLIGVACVPGAICQLLLDELAEKYLFNPISVALTLFVGALFMIYAENRYRKLDQEVELKMTFKQALMIGCFQCLAIIPGMSRSASTIIGGWVSGLSTVAAAEFSFFLAIPVMLGMSALKIIKMGGMFGLSSVELIALAIGFVVSLMVALVVIERFISYLKKKPMKIFAYYRIGFAAVVLTAGFRGLF